MAFVYATFIDICIDGNSDFQELLLITLLLIYFAFKKIFFHHMDKNKSFLPGLSIQQAYRISLSLFCYLFGSCMVDFAERRYQQNLSLSYPVCMILPLLLQELQSISKQNIKYNQIIFSISKIQKYISKILITLIQFLKYTVPCYLVLCFLNSNIRYYVVGEEYLIYHIVILLGRLIVILYGVLIVLKLCRLKNVNRKLGQHKSLLILLFLKGIFCVYNFYIFVFLYTQRIKLNAQIYSFSKQLITPVLLLLIISYQFQRMVQQKFFNELDAKRRLLQSDRMSSDKTQSLQKVNSKNYMVMVLLQIVTFQLQRLISINKLLDYFDIFNGKQVKIGQQQKQDIYSLKSYIIVWLFFGYAFIKVLNEYYKQKSYLQDSDIEKFTNAKSGKFQKLYSVIISQQQNSDLDEDFQFSPEINIEMENKNNSVQ